MYSVHNNISIWKESYMEVISLPKVLLNFIICDELEQHEKIGFLSWNMYSIQFVRYTAK